jgi:hypothetical protein
LSAGIRQNELLVFWWRFQVIEVTDCFKCRSI